MNLYLCTWTFIFCGICVWHYPVLNFGHVYHQNQNHQKSESESEIRNQKNFIFPRGVIKSAKSGTLEKSKTRCTQKGRQYTDG